MRKLGYFGAAFAGAVMFASAGNAATVETSVNGALFSAPTNGSGPIDGTPCPVGTFDCFVMAADTEVGIDVEFPSTDGGDTFSHSFQFEVEPADLGLRFETSINETNDYVSFTITLAGTGLGPTVINVDLDSPLNVVFAALLLKSTLMAPELYTLTLSGELKALTNETAAYNVQINPVPLPAALPLFGTGLGILGFLGWRRRRKQTAQVAA